MTDTLVSFKTAKLAKEKGFPQIETNFQNYYSYPNGVQCVDENVDFKTIDIESLLTYQAPTQSLLQKWLREMYGIDVYIMIYPKHMRERLKKSKYGIMVCNDAWNPACLNNLMDSNSSDIPEEVIEIGLQEALTLI